MVIFLSKYKISIRSYKHFIDENLKLYLLTTYNNVEITKDEKSSKKIYAK